MNAIAKPGPTRIGEMTIDDLNEVMAIETAIYEFPWTRGNVIDSLAAGYAARTLRNAEGRLLGYYVAMAGVEEMHLLNLSVGTIDQGQGHGWQLLDHLVGHCQRHRALTLWLEVRMSNTRAAALYRRYGFQPIGARRGYYPAPAGKREDAQVMSLLIATTVIKGGHAD